LSTVAEVPIVRFSGEGRFNYTSEAKVVPTKFLTPGLVSYKDMPNGGVELLRKETIDEALGSLEGIPLTIDHIDPSSKIPLEDVSNGTVSAGRFNAQDGWFWCDTAVETEQAKRDIRSGQSPSVGYEVLEWGPGGMYQNIRYNREIKKIRFHHMAIVPRPRYTDSIFRLNSIINTDPTMNAFKLFKKLVGRETATDPSASPKVESIDVSGDTEVVIDGVPVRLNELGKIWMAQTKEAVTATAGGDDELEIDGERVKMNALADCWRTARKNAVEEEAKKKKEAEAETARNNALSEEQKQAEADKTKREEAEKTRLNADKKSFFELRDAPVIGGSKQTYSGSSGSMSEQIERGKKRY
jgi:hypothetical protein